MNVLAMLPSQLQDASVEGGQDQAIVNRHAEKLSIGDLLMAMQTPEEGLRQGVPVVSHGMVMEPRAIGRIGQ